MKMMMELLLSYLRGMVKLTRDNRAVTALEYGLIAALIAVVIIGSVATLGRNLSGTFEGIAKHFHGDRVEGEKPNY
jgi:pilus assembly protein Flp/PilA